MLRVGGLGEGSQFPTFDAESKFAKIQNSHVRWEGDGGVGGPNFQLLMLSPNLLKKIFFGGKKLPGNCFGRGIREPQ